MKLKLEEAYDLLKNQTAIVGLRWIEPGFWPDIEGDEPHYTWCGNGPQGQQPATFSMYFDKEMNVVSSFVTWADFNAPGVEHEHLINYKRYLELNGWL